VPNAQIAAQHARVIAGTLPELPAFLIRTETRGNTMPLLFYLPMIIWLGALGAVQDEMRGPVPVKVKTRR
jgi:hypothetical protein